MRFSSFSYESCSPPPSSAPPPAAPPWSAPPPSVPHLSLFARPLPLALSASLPPDEPSTLRRPSKSSLLGEALLFSFMDCTAGLELSGGMGRCLEGNTRKRGRKKISTSGRPTEKLLRLANESAGDSNQRPAVHAVADRTCSMADRAVKKLQIREGV